MVINCKECPEEKLSLTSTSSDNTVLDYTMHKAQLENFLGAIEGKTTLVMDGNEGKRALSIIEKVYLSARQKPERTREKVR